MEVLAGVGLHVGRFANLSSMLARQQGLAVSVGAPAKLFLGFRPAETDFSCFCAEITRHTNVPLRGSLPSSQLSCYGIPLDMMLVGPEEDICPWQASVLTAICPCARCHHHKYEEEKKPV